MVRTNLASITLLAAASLATAALSPAWSKLALGMTLAEVNSNTDRDRIDAFYKTARDSIDGTGLDGVEKAVADALFDKFYHANTLQIMALRDLNDYLFLQIEDPETWFGAKERKVETVDFRLPKELLETCGVFDTDGKMFPVEDIPDCKVCSVQW